MPSTDDVEQFYANQPSQPPAPRTVTREPAEQRYLRQTRNATVFMAWVIGVWVALSLIIGLVLGIGLMHAVNQINTNGGTGGSITNCLSQGGTNPNC